MPYIISNSESYFWNKLRTKGEREIERKGERDHSDQLQREGGGSPGESPRLGILSSAAVTLSHSNSVIFISISSNSLQLAPSYSAISTSWSALWSEWVLRGCWFLSLYMHVIRSLNINQKLQAKSRKNGEKEGWISHQRQLLPVSTCCGNSVFVSVMRIKVCENKNNMKNSRRMKEKIVPQRLWKTLPQQLMCKAAGKLKGRIWKCNWKALNNREDEAPKALWDSQDGLIKAKTLQPKS